jgi:hypothetical protein
MFSPLTRIQLSDPDERLLGKQIRQSTGTISITAEKDGRHEYCFSNQMSAIADKIVRYVDHMYFRYWPDTFVQLQRAWSYLCGRRWSVTLVPRRVEV